MKFNEIEDLKQLKSDEELIDKCIEIVDSLDSFTKNEKYGILKTLLETFIETCEKYGIAFYEFGKELPKKEDLQND